MVVWDEEELDRLEKGYIEKDELGWYVSPPHRADDRLMTCPPGSLSNSSSSRGGDVSFVHDFMESMDFCKRPEMVKQVCSTYT